MICEGVSRFEVIVVFKLPVLWTRVGEGDRLLLGESGCLS
ncbi:hypothetical protein K227x_04010 [Rubripirellula lacrimiformis]|uniref:Uncharacterized protein n=1 Tax=Rubripirellula lacrimiformis TaxID=1930273 RepID=A0A517N4G0_9BACT|nr:hypothetical protein K227x_04010 [Rubripirellula lacrimiformis]